jgi:hypothetical protein
MVEKALERHEGDPMQIENVYRGLANVNDGKD